MRGGERRVAAHGKGELLVQPAEVPPERSEHPVDGAPVKHRAKPAIGEGGQWVGVHHQCARGRTCPASNPLTRSTRGEDASIRSGSSPSRTRCNAASSLNHR